jgi:predicted GTPase
MFFIIFFQDIVFFNTLCFSEFILSHNSSSIENFINNLNTYSHNSFSDYLFKFVLIGDSGVGKSSVINRFVVLFFFFTYNSIKSNYTNSIWIQVLKIGGTLQVSHDDSFYRVHAGQCV